jgi:acetylornithine deacetylase
VKEKIIKYIDKNKDWLFNMLMNIISKDTINRMPYGNENNGQDLIENIFKELGLEVDRFSPDEVKGIKKHSAYLKGRKYLNRDNVVGFTGEGNKKTIIFNGHIDTVPTENLNWKITKPLSPKIVNNKIYGIGACDMKGGLVSSIFALKTIIDLDINIEGKVILESVVDEEFGGANGTLACIEKGYEGDFAIIPEPTNMGVYPILISQNIFDVYIKGKEGLEIDSYRGDSISLAARLINALLDYENYLNSLKSKFRLYKDYDKPIAFTCAAISAGKMGDNELFTAPMKCLFRICIRNYPNCYDEGSFNNTMFNFLNKYKDIKKNIANGNISFKKKYRFFPGTKYRFDSKENRSYIDSLNKISHFVLNEKIREIGGRYAGDLFLFNNFSNTPAIFYGPGGGGIHAADEYVNAGDIVNLSKIFALFIYDYCC